jgi:hypothetical protein
MPVRIGTGARFKNTIFNEISFARESHAVDD